MIPKPSPWSGRGLRLSTSHGVDCWIGVVQQAGQRLVRLAGRLSVAQVPELLEACAGALPLEINLADLVSADPAGIEALQRLRDRGATLVGAPGYIQLKLDSHQDGPVGGPLQTGIRSKNTK
jgi:hypothetical protein